MLEAQVCRRLYFVRASALPKNRFFDLIGESFLKLSEGEKLNEIKSDISADSCFADYFVRERAAKCRKYGAN
jgi:hypothetical protein